MDILISNLLSESIFDFGKWSNGKYTKSAKTAKSAKTTKSAITTKKY